MSARPPRIGARRVLVESVADLTEEALADVRDLRVCGELFTCDWCLSCCEVDHRGYLVTKRSTDALPSHVIRRLSAAVNDAFHPTLGDALRWAA